MRDTKQRLKISTGRSYSDFWLFFLSCCQSVGSALFAFSLMPAFQIFFPLSLELADFSSCGGFPHDSVRWGQPNAGWDGEERETQEEREAVSEGMRVWAPVSLYQYPGNATTQPSPAQSIQVVSRETRTRYILICNVNYTPVVRASHSPAGLFAAIILFWLVYDDWPALHTWSEAKETILHCSREKKSTGDCVGVKTSTTALHVIEDMNVY